MHTESSCVVDVLITKIFLKWISCHSVCPQNLRWVLSGMWVIQWNRDCEICEMQFSRKVMRPSEVKSELPIMHAHQHGNTQANVSPHTLWAAKTGYYLRLAAFSCWDNLENLILQHCFPCTEESVQTETWLCVSFIPDVWIWMFVLQEIQPLLLFLSLSLSLSLSIWAPFSYSCEWHLKLLNVSPDPFFIGLTIYP